ncbi:MAG: hypothetical protein V8T45_07285 [Oscillospiraceae bacterium]
MVGVSASAAAVVYEGHTKASVEGSGSIKDVSSISLANSYQEHRNCGGGNVCRRGRGSECGRGRSAQ